MKNSGKRTTAGYELLQQGVNKGIYEITVTPEDLEDIFNKQQGRCFWFNVPLDPQSVFVSYNPLAISADRINNTLGYSKDNVVLCTRCANLARGSASLSDFMTVTATIGKHYDESQVRQVRKARKVDSPVNPFDTFWS